MKPVSSECAVGIDIGAGSGAKMGLFTREGNLLGESLLPIERYGRSPVVMVGELAGALRDLVKGSGSPPLIGAGVAMPGFACSDGTVRCNNLPFLDHVPFVPMMEQAFGLSVCVVNDADAGGLAEWSHARTELLYWVFGGGWGGAWISADGQVRYPAVDWDGDDDTLHYSNEPGYAIPLSRERMGVELASLGGSWEGFERICMAEREWPGGRLAGPNGRLDCVRAELFVSGNGRWRIFRTLAAADGYDLARLTPEERQALETPSNAGRVIDRLAEQGCPVVRRTDLMFGRALAAAAEFHFRSGPRGNCPDGVAIYVGGKPSRALPWFGPEAESVMRARGLHASLKLSWFSERNLNANLAGAAVLAWNRLKGS
ncbi:MAG: hypothetical protein A2340_05625 [Lentisphaerae bacterium RIFOXYB12_FULL_60_10]|nr:MAG: hypothetical protein A2269_03165 [Lentisphaerae bacterium RIFOXYA12_FULL_60_10]OGV75163.1 MAG: hypothetical protein A2340_05625 [Lentisphaerae bacterium RIFOXYB12_FULL_60_10]